MTDVSTARRVVVRPAVDAAPYPRAVLFSDVDGTLLGARGALATTAGEIARAAATVDIVLTSSRTIAELLELQRRLGLEAPLIAENGALLAFPAPWRGARPGVVRRIAGRPIGVLALGAPAARIRDIVRRAARHAQVPIVEQRDTLPDEGRALARTHSVLVRYHPRGGSAWRYFLIRLHERGLVASRSGHWLTITRGADKGTGVRALLAAAVHAGAPYQVTAAVGNAENDLPLLRAAAHRFVVRDPRHGADPLLTSIVGARAMSASGIHGWPEALHRVLAQLRNR